MKRMEDKCSRCGTLLEAHPVEYHSYRAQIAENFGIIVAGVLTGSGGEQGVAPVSVFVCQRCAKELEENRLRPQREHSLKEMLAGLDSLRRNGTITTQDYEARKLELLDEFNLMQPTQRPSVKQRWGFLRRQIRS
jgi:hypothetical protein